jgi:hypothetical protein
MDSGSASVPMLRSPAFDIAQEYEEMPADGPERMRCDFNLATLHPAYHQVPSRLRFWALAARRNSSSAPFGPLKRRRARRRIRLRCANSISTFFRRRQARPCECAAPLHPPMRTRARPPDPTGCARSSTTASGSSPRGSARTSRSGADAARTSRIGASNPTS